MLHAALDDIGESVDVLFWSGGKDSYLALQSLRKESVREVVLLTTYDYNTSAVAHQEVRIKDVVGQAKRLSIPLIGVPVGHGEYVQLVRDALDKLRNNGIVIERVAFGDLHLRHIREWREKELAILGADLYYPLWNIPYEALLKELETANVTVRVSALDKENELLQGARVGDTFNRSFLMSLPPGIDKFGENGEFHTFVDVC